MCVRLTLYSVQPTYRSIAKSPKVAFDTGCPYPPVISTWLHVACPLPLINPEGLLNASATASADLT